MTDKDWEKKLEAAAPERNLFGHSYFIDGANWAKEYYRKDLEQLERMKAQVKAMLPSSIQKSHESEDVGWV